MGIETLAIAALAVAVIGTGVEVYGGIKSAEAQSKAEAARRRMEEVRAARERTQQVREARAKVAAIQASSENQGAGESSSAITGAGGVVSSRNANLGFINQQEGIAAQISQANQQNINAQGIATLGAGLAKIGGTVFANRDEVHDIGADIFGPKKVSGGNNYDG